MYFVYFSHVLGSPFMVYSRNSIHHVNCVNWGLDSGEVSKSIGQLFYIKFNEFSNTSVIHIIQGNLTCQNSVILPFCAFVRVCMCVCMLV